MASGDAPPDAGVSGALADDSPEPVTLGRLHRDARARLADAGVATPDLDARLLVEQATGTTRLDAVREPRRSVPAEALRAAESALARRMAGEPVHRILGYREFHGLRLALSPDTLEPRPDTETLVDTVVPRLARLATERGSARFLDLGTGTGAIALAVLSVVPQARAVATDVAPGALETASRNAADNGLADRFEPLLSDWFDQITGRYDAILSNPPYITENEHAALAREVRNHDPRRALVAGDDGLDAYRALAAGAKAFLEPWGFIGLEIGSSQRQDVTAIFMNGGYVLLDAVKDIGGRDRVLVFGV